MIKPQPNTCGGFLLFLARYIHTEPFLFCCSLYDPSDGNKNCTTTIGGRYAPLSLEAEQVIFNLTSGSTTTDNAIIK